MCLIACERERIVYNSSDSQGLGCTFKLCRTTKFPGCDFETYSQWGLWHPYSVIAAVPQDTNQWESQGVGVNDIQGIFCTNIQRNHYCKANLSFSISFTVFSPLSSYSRHCNLQRAYLWIWYKRCNSSGYYFYTVSLGLITLWSAVLFFYLTASQVFLVSALHCCVFSVQMPPRPYNQRELFGKSLRLHTLCQPALSPRHLRGSLSVPILVPLQWGIPGPALRGDACHVPRRQQQPQPELHVRHQYLCHGLSR